MDSKFVVQVLLMLNLVIMILFSKAKSDSGGYGDENGGVSVGVGVGVGVGFGVYKDACPEAEDIIFSLVKRAVMEDSRMAASLLRLHFHDCFVNACAHTMGKARCSSFSARLQDTTDGSPAFIQSLQQLCSGFGNGGGSSSSSILAQLDLVTPATFDNQYYVNLISGEGLLPSDQVLVTGDDQTRQLVETYAQDTFAFFDDFQNSMLKMGALGVLTGSNGEIRRNCRTIN
ncbi:hypothetical protein F8388_012885 [Cannabis sativa]|uniref:peroxidase n=1 Tax=Cannabis sativa TaxID=3483 RepID=A0A7J6EST5_CANSA|nr:hypothetical protein F8388_012885 [Cannabis sativa]